MLVFETLKGYQVEFFRNLVVCKFCGIVISSGITRLKDHLAHIPVEGKGCGKVTTLVRENMMNLICENKTKKKDIKKLCEV